MFRVPDGVDGVAARPGVETPGYRHVVATRPHSFVIDRGLRSAPDVSLVVFDFVALQDRSIFVLKIPLAVMLPLRGGVVDDCR